LCSLAHDPQTAQRSGLRDVKEIVTSLNPVLRGWGNYFRTGNADREFHRIDEYAYRRVIRWMQRRGGQRARHRWDQWPRRECLYKEFGLYQLRGTVSYPVQATPPRPSVSRVRETRTHGLKGGPGNGAAKRQPHQILPVRIVALPEVEVKVLPVQPGRDPEPRFTPT